MDAGEYPRDYHRLGADSMLTMLPAGTTIPVSRRFQSLRHLEQRTRAESVLPLAALIFHCSRCGSTLLARILELDTGNRVFAEPDALPKFLAAHEAALMRGDGVSELRAFIQSFGLMPMPDERRLIIKLTSRSIAYLPAFRAAFPEVPFLYLFRDPVEVVASLKALPPSFLYDNQRHAVAASFGEAPARLAELPPTQWFAWYVDRNLRAGLRHAAQFTESIDYGDYARSYFHIASRLSGIALSAESPGMEHALSRHSKNRTTSFKAAGTGGLTPEQCQATALIAGDAYALWCQKKSRSS